jgi:CrcB protein
MKATVTTGGTHRARGPVVLLMVFLGGSLGSLARELLTPMLLQPWEWFPTLLVNVSACLMIGWLFTLRGRLPAPLMHLAVGGFCGGFSTFSHLSYEVVMLADAGQALEAWAYIAASVSLGIGAAMLGEWLGGGIADSGGAGR